MSDDCVLSAGGQSLSGWQSVEVVTGLEIMPSVFNIGMTDKVSAASPKVIARPGDPCTVALGDDPVITGYVDRLAPSIDANSHGISVSGRSKSADLVDCSAVWESGQITGSSVLEICKKLCKPFGIDVEGDVDTGPPIPQYNFVIGDTPFAVMESLARFRQLLIYDLPNGNIILTQASKGKMASGITQGVNIQKGQAVYSMDGRFSIYETFMVAVDMLGDAGAGGNLKATIKDAGVPRFRLMTNIAADGALGLDVAIATAQWDCNRRAARSQAVTVTVDSWRDSDRKLWKPNYEIPCDAASLKLPPDSDWLITQATFRKDAQGTTADLVVMPAGGFKPQPILLVPLPIDVLQATGG